MASLHFPSLTKTRLAPTPSGYLHLGNVFSFVLTLALARKTGASVLLRIDDMDRQRANSVFVQDIFETLRFLEIPFEEGPQNPEELELRWSQPHRMALYKAALQHLMDEGRVFACTCSRTGILQKNPDGAYPGTCREKNLPLNFPGSALRVKTSSETNFLLPTLSGKRRVTDLPASVRDFIVRKKDGSPAYQLCSVVDDLHFGIDLIVRGADLWPSTLAQCWLSTLLPSNRFAENLFVHHTLLRTDAGEKLSKSAGSTSIHGMRKQGLSRSDVFQRLSHLLHLEQPVSDWETLGYALMKSPETFLSALP